MTCQYLRAERLLTRSFSTSFDIEDASEPLTNGHAFSHTTSFLDFRCLAAQDTRRSSRHRQGEAPSTGSQGTFLDIGTNRDALGRRPMNRILPLVFVHAATMPLHIACMHHLPHLRSKFFFLVHEKEPEAAMSFDTSTPKVSFQTTTFKTS